MSLKIVSVGEVLWDFLPDGRHLGGAPANFAYHVHTLGAETSLISRIGKDTAGDDILNQFHSWRLPAHLVQGDAAAETGRVTVTLDAAGVPQFTIHQLAAWDFLELTAPALDAARQANAICFGSLAQRRIESRQAIQQLVAATSPEALRIFDINLRQQFYSREVIVKSFELANVIKLNDTELTTITQMFDLNPRLETAVEELARRFDLRTIAVTCGPSGSYLFQKGRWSHLRSKTNEVADTVGAGDAFNAALTVGLASGMDLEQVHQLANEAASFVCTQSGATPAMPTTFIRQFSNTSTHN